MGSFLNNIIARHAAATAGGASTHLVEPRLKSRFEADPGNGNPALPDNQLNRAIDAFTEPHPQSQHSTPVFIPDKRTELPAAGFSSEQPGDRSAPVSATPVQGRLATPAPPGRSPYQNKPGREAQSATAWHPESENSPGPTTDNLLNQRIAALLRELNAGPGSYLGQRLPEVSGNAFVHPQTVESTPPAVTLSPLPAEPEAGAGSKVSLKTRNGETHPVSPELHQAGLFQNPEWLAEIRSDLQRRARQPAAQSPSEPVINVTIGRVEVRATGAETRRSPAAGNKPSGIMSLDDYLEKRNGRQF